MLTRFIRITLLALPAFATLGCASMTRPNTYGLDAEHAALVRQTCTHIMGLRSGVAEFEACGGSLAESMRVLNDATLTARADQWCEQQGHSAGSAELAKCVVTFRRTAGQPDSVRVETLAANQEHPWKSYFSMTHSQQTERTELSCAQLGLHPASGAFKYCVTNLRQAIVESRTPSFL